MITNKRLDGHSNRAIEVHHNGMRFLISYWTIVAYEDSEGKFHRLWDGYSQTTVKNHVAIFGHNFSKKEWEALPVESLPKGVSSYDIMDYETRNREIKNYSESFYYGTSYSRGWSYGF